MYPPIPLSIVSGFHILLLIFSTSIIMKQKQRRLSLEVYNS